MRLKLFARISLRDGRNLFKYVTNIIMTSDAFLLQNNAFKRAVCTALLWKKILQAIRCYSKLANSSTDNN